MKGLVTRNIQVQYEGPISSGLKVMAKVKVFQKKDELQGQGHNVKNYGTMWKVLSQGIHICNMKALSFLVWKLWPRLKIFKSRSNFKVKVRTSKIMIPCERSCHKEYTCVNENPISSGLKVMAKVKVFNWVKVQGHNAIRVVRRQRRLLGDNYQ